MEKVVAKYAIPLKKLGLSGMYPVLLIGKWFITIQQATYAQYSEHKFWFGMKGHS